MAAKFDLKNLSGPNFRIVGGPILILLILVALFFVVYQVGFGKIQESRTKIRQKENEVTSLEEKKRLLEEVEAVTQASRERVSIALPEENATLSVISQIKEVAVLNSVLVKDIKTAASVKTDAQLEKAEVIFEAEGDFFSIVKLLEDLTSSLPLISLGKVKLRLLDNQSQADVSLNAYWSEFPKKIPALAEKINGLNENEIEVLELIAGFKLPNFSSLKPTNEAAKADPFN